MKRIYLIIVGPLAVLGVIWLILFIGVQNQPIPRHIISQAGFGIWYPQSAAFNLKVEPDSIKYNDTGSDKLVTFVASSASQNLSFTEQATPASFNDVPQLYDQLVNKLRGYSSFDGVNGTVSLTRPEELKGGQTAIMNAKGTLVFVKPDKDLSSDDWRKLMNNLGFAH